MSKEVEPNSRTHDSSTESKEVKHNFEHEMNRKKTKFTSSVVAKYSVRAKKTLGTELTLK